MNIILWIVYFVVILFLFLWKITTTQYISVVTNPQYFRKGDRIKYDNEGPYKIKKIKGCQLFIKKKTNMKERLKTLRELLHRKPRAG